MQKKIVGLAVVLLLAMSSAMYAQELKFDGYLNTGLGVVATDQDGSDPYLRAAAVDAEQGGYRFRLNGSYTNEAKNAGARFRFQSQTNINTADLTYDKDGDITGASATTRGYFSLPYAFGWVSFLDNKLTVNGGIVEDSTWSTGDWWLASDSVSAYTGLGALLKVTPIDGLALGVGAYTINRRGGSNNNILAKDALNSSVNLEDAKYTIHAGYTMKDVFRVDFSYRTENAGGGGTADLTSRLFGDFRYLGKKDLTAVVAISADKLEDFSDKGEIILSETFGYKIDSLNLGLNAVQSLFNRPSGQDVDPGLLFNVWGSYAIDNIVPRLDIVYFMNGESSSGVWHRKAFTVAGYKERSVLSFRPSVKINLDSRTFLEIGDLINYDFSDKALDSSGDKSRLTNVFYVDLKWSF